MANVMAQAPMWLGKYPMSDTAHEPDLQMRADINEHMYRMPRADAQAAAHRDYRHDQIVEAAAHHYVGMKASHAAGNEEAAKKHGLMYGLAMHQLGHKNLMVPPDEVLQRTKKTPSEDIARFKAHKSDVFTMPPQEPGEEPKRTGNEMQVKTAALAKAGDPLFQQQGYQNHPLGSTGGGLKHDQDKQDELVNIAYHGAMPIEAKFNPQNKAGAKNVFHEHQEVPSHPRVTADMSATPEAGILAGALAARQAVRYLIRAHASRNPLNKAEEPGPKCSACGGPFHPDTGHHPPGYDDVRVCGPCTHHFVEWLKTHTRRPYGSKETPFYEAAKTSIKPGDGDKK